MNAPKTWRYIQGNEPKWRTRGPGFGRPMDNVVVVSGLVHSGHCWTHPRAAEQTPFNFYKELAAAGFGFNVLQTAGAKRLGTLSPRSSSTGSAAERPPRTVRLLRRRHAGGDRGPRRGHPAPAGSPPSVREGALVAVADNYTKTNLLIGSKRRIAGLRLRATDCEWFTVRALKSAVRSRI